MASAIAPMAAAAAAIGPTACPAIVVKSPRIVPAVPKFCRDVLSFATFPAIPAIASPPIPIAPRLSHDVRPPSSPPGRSLKAELNRFPMIPEIVVAPFSLAHCVSGSAMRVSQAMSIFPMKSASFQAEVRFICSTSSLKPSKKFETKSPSFGSCPVMESTKDLTTGSIPSPKLSLTPSRADCISVTEPARLSIIVSDIDLEAPSAPSMASASLSKSSSEALTIASAPAMACLPKIVLAAAVCSSSESPPRESRMFSMTCMRVFCFPSPSVKEIPYFSIASASASVGETRFVIIRLREVPAIEDLIPELAMIPSA